MRNPKNSRWRPSSEGSAYVIALGVVSVPIILVLLFSRTSVAWRFTTKFLSAENKAGALAEAAVDLGLRRVKDEMNTSGN